jgi:hypothetical protein
MKKCFLFVFSLIFLMAAQFPGLGQKFIEDAQKPSIGIVAGYSGFRNDFLQFGIGWQPWELDLINDLPLFPFFGFMGLYEVDPWRKIQGVSLNASYYSGLFACGLDVNRYTNQTHVTFGLRPLIGMSMLRMGILYGYNIFLNENSIEGLNRNSLTFRYYLPLWTDRRP